MRLAKKKLLRLMNYVHSSIETMMIGWVDQTNDDADLHLFTDSDFAGCAVSQRSTTGVHLVIAGKYTQFPLNAVSKRQSCVGVSTPEVEGVAANHGVTYELIPAMDFANKILRANFQSYFHEETLH